jgi:TetR/AcrR family transcriptional regulator, cholesterol catabolism regulator
MANEKATDRSLRRQMSLDDRRHEIVTAAADQFDKLGYANTTMDDIARIVGIAKPTLYHYFASKDQILSNIHEEFIDILIDKHQRRELVQLPPEQMLLEIMVDILELMHTHRGHVRVFFEHHRELPDDSRRDMRKKRDHYEAAVTEVVRRGIEDGTFRGIDGHLASLGIFGMCNWAYQWYRPSGSLKPREIAYQFWDMITRGIGGGAARAS